MTPVSVRYITDDVDAAVDFYAERLGFKVKMWPGPGFAMLSRGDLRLLLNRPGAGGAGQPMPDGRRPQPGGWNRIQIEVSNLEREVQALRQAGARFRSDIVTGRGGSQILLEDPSGNPIELFQPAAESDPERSSTVPNLTTNVLLHGEETGGHVSVTEIIVPPQSAGPPLHRHDFDEAFYMLEGKLIFQVADALVTKGAGEVSFAARNEAHTLANHSDASARYVLVCTPAGFERHWARIAADAAGVEPPPWALQPIPEVTVVGPQIAARA
jgi:catechol 2,3-dioxygenase-like lactoylglutathione lyase family enzyme/quercetin dioxygenase-like cupin family protein